MAQYELDGLETRLTTQRPDEGKTWNGFNVPRVDVAELVFFNERIATEDPASVMVAVEHNGQVIYGDPCNDNHGDDDEEDEDTVIELDGGGHVHLDDSSIYDIEADGTILLSGIPFRLVEESEWEAHQCGEAKYTKVSHHWTASVRGNAWSLEQAFADKSDAEAWVHSWVGKSVACQYEQQHVWVRNGEGHLKFDTICAACGAPGEATVRLTDA